jgi:hypothetical protein
MRVVEPRSAVFLSWATQQSAAWLWAMVGFIHSSTYDANWATGWDSAHEAVNSFPNFWIILNRFKYVQLVQKFIGK